MAATTEAATSILPEVAAGTEGEEEERSWNLGGGDRETRRRGTRVVGGGRKLGLKRVSEGTRGRRAGTWGLGDSCGELITWKAWD